METYILHIYRRDRNISDSLVGLVEEVGVEGKKPFRNLGQFWDVLNAKAGETVQGENEKAKNEERRIHHESINLDRQSGIDWKK